MDPVSTWMESFPMWLVTARVKAGDVLRIDATSAEIDVAAAKASEETVRLAASEGYALVMPTARVTVRPHYCDGWDADGLEVQAWCQAVQVAP